MYGPGTLALSAGPPAQAPAAAGEPLKLVDRAEPARGAAAPPTTLCLPRWSCAGRPEPPRAGGLQVDPLDEPVERQVEVQPGLLAVGDHVQPRRELSATATVIASSWSSRDVVGAEAVEVLRRELEPAGKGLGADDGER